LLTPIETIATTLLGRVQDINHLVMGFDGGGVRGATTSEFLAQLEAESGVPLYKQADLLGGISTGSIIAGCLACGVPASIINDFYKGCKKYFQRNWFPPFPLKPIYKKQPLQDCIEELIGKHMVMGECKTRLMVGAVDLCSDDNVYFKSWRPEWKELKVSEALVRSFSAAVYFGATSVPQEQRVYADGGEGNGNCPLLELILESYKLGFRDEGFYVVSVGTGEARNMQSYKEASGYSPAIGQTAEYMGLARRQAVRTQVNYAAQIRALNRKFDFCRIDIEIPKNLDELAGTEHIAEYQELGKRLAMTYITNGKLGELMASIYQNKKNFNKAEWLKREIYLKSMELNQLSKGGI
jgi:hypothetical protein